MAKTLKIDILQTGAFEDNASNFDGKTSTLPFPIPSIHIQYFHTPVCHWTERLFPFPANFCLSSFSCFSAGVFFLGCILLFDVFFYLLSQEAL